MSIHDYFAVIARKKAGGGESNFDIDTYTGTGATLERSPLSFQPDAVWLKSRSTTESHHIYDVVRGATKSIQPGENTAEETNAAGLTSFDADGYTVGTYAEVNTLSDEYVAWCFGLGGSGSSNTAGTINSTVSAASNGFMSAVKYTGTNGSGANEETVGHGLGDVPEAYIVKELTSSSTGGLLYTDIFDGSLDYMFWNSTGAAAGSASNNPTSSAFSIGGSINTSGKNYIAYAFRNVSGQCKVGKYTGNGSTSGPSITGLGTTGRAVIIKQSNATRDWVQLDDQRTDQYFRWNPVSADTAGAWVTWTSDGFDIKSDATNVNVNGGTYFYILFG